MQPACGRPWQLDNRKLSWLFGLGADAADDVWAVGRRFASDGSIATLALHWDGTDWTSVPTPKPRNGAEFEQVDALGRDDAWAVGTTYGRHGRRHSLLEHWDGSTWSQVSGAEEPPTPELQGVEAIGADDVWAVGSTGNVGKIYAEHYDGSSWTRSPLENPFGSYTVLRDVSAVSSTDVWAVGYAPAKLHHLVFMHWDGSKWSAWRP